MNDLLKSKYNLVVVLGPTASGKTTFAVRLADTINGEIISADSRQIYRRMNLGTGKDYDDYKVREKPIPCHLIDIKEPGYKYNVFEFQKDFLQAFRQIQESNRFPILCGGTGMYIEAVTRGYKMLSVPVNEDLRKKLHDKTLEELESILATYRKVHNKTDSDTKKRAIRAIEIEVYYSQHKEPPDDYPDIRPVYLGIQPDREIRRDLISKRLLRRIEQGMIGEVKQLLDDGISANDLIYYGLEYKFITLYLTGNINYESMIEKLTIAIHQFAKRQMTWFRKMEREGIKIHWLDFILSMEDKLAKALEILQNNTTES